MATTHSKLNGLTAKSRMKKHKLYLVPTPIGRQKENLVLPDHTVQVIHSLEQFVVEKAQTSLSFLQWIRHPKKDFELTFRVLNKKTPDQEVLSFVRMLENGDVGIMSEAGAPGVADPGARLVNLAHEHGYPVVPLVGPSSILLALMASGLNGQKFAFHGYLPISQNDRKKELARLEQQSMDDNQTQIIMETPHRNTNLLQMILDQCRPSTRLTIAANLTMPDQLIQTKPIYQWKAAELPDLQKVPALFLLLA